MPQTNRQKHEKQLQTGTQTQQSIAPVGINDVYQWAHQRGYRQGVLDVTSQFQAIRKREREFEKATHRIELDVNAIADIVGLLKNINRSVIPGVLKADGLLRKDGRSYSERLSSDITRFLNKYRAFLDTEEIDAETWSWAEKWIVLAKSVGQLEDINLDGLDEKAADAKLKVTIETVHEDLRHVTGVFYDDLIENVSNRKRGGKPEGKEAYRSLLEQDWLKMKEQHPKAKPKAIKQFLIEQYEQNPAGNVQKMALDELRDIRKGGESDFQRDLLN